VREDDCIRTEVLMDTPVTIQVPRDGLPYVKPAFDWFHRVEACCSRFDAKSELMRLTARIGVPVPVSAIVYQAVQFALTMAEESGGAFDPTVGHAMEMRGFNREHRTGLVVETRIDPDGPVSFRDVHLDPKRQTITIDRPLVLDLGAVAKGLAIDLAAHELGPLKDFAIDAGGDLYLAGCRPDGGPWSVGIRHPRPARRAGTGQQDEEVIEVLHVSDLAVCTSGDYERRTSDDAEGHIIDPRTGASAPALASVTVVAPTAMVADAAATAAFVLGPTDGLRLCENLGVDALMLSPTCERFATRGMLSGHYGSSRAVLSNAQGPSDDRPRHPRRPRRTDGRH
jgi:thiamine biosynthesis lipoprotein